MSAAREGAGRHPQLLEDGMYETGRFADVDPSTVVTREDAIGVVKAMTEDVRRYPGAWENSTLERFLEALAELRDRTGKARQLGSYRQVSLLLLMNEVSRYTIRNRRNSLH